MQNTLYKALKQATPELNRTGGWELVHLSLSPASLHGKESKKQQTIPSDLLMFQAAIILRLLLVHRHTFPNNE